VAISRCAQYQERVVAEQGIARPTIPSGNRQHLRVNPLADIDHIVIDGGVLSAAQMELASVIVSTDVVPDDRSDISNIFLLVPLYWRADQHEAAFVNVAVGRVAIRELQRSESRQS
jgi:hypothetical protein